MRYAYPCDVVPDEEEARLTGCEAYNASFPDVHGAHTCGSTAEEMTDRLQDCLETALGGYLHDSEDLPEPSSAGLGQILVAVSPAVAARLALYTAMRSQAVTARASLTDSACVLQGSGASLTHTALPSSPHWKPHLQPSACHWSPRPFPGHSTSSTPSPSPPSDAPAGRPDARNPTGYEPGQGRPSSVRTASLAASRSKAFGSYWLELNGCSWISRIHSTISSWSRWRGSASASHISA